MRLAKESLLLCGFKQDFWFLLHYYFVFSTQLSYQHGVPEIFNQSTKTEKYKIWLPKYFWSLTCITKRERKIFKTVTIRREIMLTNIAHKELTKK